MLSFTFNTTPSIIFAAGALAGLGEAAALRLGPRVLVVTDAGLVRAGLVEAALQSLTRSGISFDVYEGVVADPPEAVVLEASSSARAFDATGIIGLGGGSSLDVA